MSSKNLSDFFGMSDWIGLFISKWSYNFFSDQKWNKIKNSTTENKINRKVNRYLKINKCKCIFKKVYLNLST